MDKFIKTTLKELSKQFDKVYHDIQNPTTFRNVPIEKVNFQDKLVGETAKGDKGRVDEFKKIIETGKDTVFFKAEDILKPLGVREVDGVLYARDGNHRLEAYRQLGFKEIPVMDYDSKEFKEMMADKTPKGKGDNMEEFKIEEKDLGFVAVIPTTVRELRNAGIELDDDLLSQAKSKNQNQESNWATRPGFVNIEYDMQPNFSAFKVNETATVCVAWNDDLKPCAQYFEKDQAGRLENKENKEKVMNFVKGVVPNLEELTKSFKDQMLNAMEPIKQDMNPGEVYIYEDDYEDDISNKSWDRER